MDRFRMATRTLSQLDRWLALCRLESTRDGTAIFSTQGPLKSPPWARGVYGGQIIALALVAACETVTFLHYVHSIHCHFLHPANVDIPLKFSVESVHDGRSFATRSVQVRQHGRLIMLATVSFGSRSQLRSGVESLCHATPMPGGEQPPADGDTIKQSTAGQGGAEQPCDCVRSTKQNKGPPSERKVRQWIRARGPIMHHAAALAYMSDNYFIGTTYRVQNASRFSNRDSPHPMLDSSQGVDRERLLKYAEALASEEMEDNAGTPKSEKQVEMMATLNHTIFFHHPRGLRADEWMLAEMEAPWAGNERAVVLQRIWSYQGTLLATCIQEGVVRLLRREHKGRL